MWCVQTSRITKDLPNAVYDLSSTRYLLFRRSAAEGEKLPPRAAAFLMHTERGFSQDSIWSNAHQSTIDEIDMVLTFKMNSTHQSQRNNQLHRKQSSKWCCASHANFVTQLVVHADKQILLSNAVTSVDAANIVRTLMHQCHKTCQKTWRKM